MKYLLSKRAKVNAKDKRGENGLHLAIGRGYVDVIRLLLAKKIDVNAKTDRGDSSLALSLRKNRQEVSELLLKAGARADGSDSAGRTPLINIARSSRNNHPEWVRLFVKNGADVNAKDKKGASALLHAIDRNNWNMALELVRNGANANDKGSSGSAVLYLRASVGNAPLATLLIKKGADVNAISVGRTALHIALTNGHLDVAQAIVTHAKKLKVNQRDGDKSGVLFKAIEANAPKIVKRIIELGGDVNQLNRTRNTPMQVAVQYGNAEIIRLVSGAGGKKPAALPDISYRCKSFGKYPKVYMDPKSQLEMTMFKCADNKHVVIFFHGVESERAHP